MKKFKKLFSLLLAVCLVMLSFTACSTDSNGSSESETQSSDETVNIVTTIFPIYDWVKQLTSGVDGTKLTMLLDSGTDLHNFQPSADDIVTISKCDMFIYVGGESDEWAEDALEQNPSDSRIDINLMELLGDNAKEEEHKEGMEETEEHGDGEDGEEEYDEHVWLSLKNAQLFCKSISESLSQLDAKDAALYSENCESYLSQLSELDNKYSQAVADAQTKTLLFADRFPFRYLTDDYGLDYYAAFSGCSAESEASFETVSFLAKKTDELGLKYVITIEGTNHNIAQTVIENTQEKNQQILVLDSMQSKTAENVNNGETYLSVTESNLTVLQQALA